MNHGLYSRPEAVAGVISLALSAFSLIPPALGEEKQQQRLEDAAAKGD